MAQADVTTAAWQDGPGWQRLPQLILGVAAVALVGSVLLPAGQIVLAVRMLAAILCAAALMLSAMSLVRKAGRMRVLRAVCAMIEHDPRPGFLCDAEGAVIACNRVARDQPPLDDLRFDRLATGEGGVPSLADGLRHLCADPAALQARLQERARVIGAAQEDLLTRRGHLRLIVQRIEGANFLWQIEDLDAARGRLAETDVLPMLTLDPGDGVIYMNVAARALAGGRVQDVAELFGDQPVQGGRMVMVATRTGPVEHLVAETPGEGGQRNIHLLPPGAAQVPRGLTTGWDAIEDLPVPLLKVAATGEVLASNREARALLQVPVDKDTRLSDLLEGLGRPVIDWLAEAAEGRGSQTPQFLRGTGEHQDIFVQVSLNSAGPEDDPHLIAVLNDVTELKTLEAQFVQSQKMQAIGQLAGGVAHDFNNLLTAISGHCDLLLLRHDQGDQDYGDLIQIHQNANRAASLVGQLLAFSRKQNLRPEVLDLRDTLSDLTHLLNRLVGEKVFLTLHHDPALLHIRADKRQLEQVLMNLVVNARDAMPEGGEIRVVTENVVLGAPIERDRAVVPAGSYVVVRVIDDGTGIPSEKLPKIFEPFYTTKRPGEGTGLGLSTAYGIVKQTGGFIFADSEVGEGATFTLYFPSHARPLPAAVTVVAPLAQTAPRTADGVVLLVEDEAPVRAFASRALRLRGYTVLEADSAETALCLLDDPDLAVDLFLTDVIMPGKDGPTWVREALIRRPATRVVFVSGYAEDAFGEHQALIPHSVFLPKPFSLNELTATVQRQLDDMPSTPSPTRCAADPVSAA